MKEVRLFNTRLDWEKELKRTKCQNWRISHVNVNYQVSPLLLETIIVPQSVTDNIIKEAVEKFRNRCCPIWVRFLVVFIYRVFPNCLQKIHFICKRNAKKIDPCLHEMLKLYLYLLLFCQPFETVFLHQGFWIIKNNFITKKKNKY